MPNIIAFENLDTLEPFKFLSLKLKTDIYSPFPHVALVTWKHDMFYIKHFYYDEYQDSDEILVSSEYVAKPGDITEKQTKKNATGISSQRKAMRYWLQTQIMTTIERRLQDTSKVRYL